jgi:hypothetical protein
MLSIGVTGLFSFVSAPAYATTTDELKLVPPSEKPTSEEKIERAYEFREGAGMVEEAYQNKLKQGEDPGNTSKPYKRTIKGDKTAVPETSPLEATADKARGLIQKVAGQD